MKIRIYYSFLLSLMLSSCFPFADNWEKDINLFFFLHEDSKDVYLGTTDQGYRIGKYLGPLAAVGWNDNFLIMKDKSDHYYIQKISFDESTIKELVPENFNAVLYGPYSMKDFETKKQQLNLPSSLTFEDQY